MPRFVIDTDTASDDAVALVMALRHPDVIVDAITVVAGNVGVDQGVRNALVTVERCDRSVPVHSGSAAPLLRPLETAQFVHGDDGMGDVGLPSPAGRAAEGRAVDVIVQSILGSPGEITLVTLGPLTNVAVAVLRAPEIADAVQRVVVMGGTGVHGPGNVSAMAEFNFWADPEAARIVVGAGMPIELVGWDISIASAVVDERRAAEIEAIGTPLAEFTLGINRAVQEFSTDLGLAGFDLPDPIAMAHAIDPTPAVTTALPVDVMVGDGPERGVMAVDRMGVEARPANAVVVTDYPADHFFGMLHRSLR